MSPSSRLLIQVSLPPGLRRYVKRFQMLVSFDFHESLTWHFFLLLAGTFFLSIWDRQRCGARFWDPSFPFAHSVHGLGWEDGEHEGGGGGLPLGRLSGECESGKYPNLLLGFSKCLWAWLITFFMMLRWLDCKRRGCYVRTRSSSKRLSSSWHRRGRRYMSWRAALARMWWVGIWKLISLFDINFGYWLTKRLHHCRRKRVLKADVVRLSPRRVAMPVLRSVVEVGALPRRRRKKRNMSRKVKKENQRRNKWLFQDVFHRKERGKRKEKERSEVLVFTFDQGHTLGFEFGIVHRCDLLAHLDSRG